MVSEETVEALVQELETALAELARRGIHLDEDDLEHYRAWRSEHPRADA